MCIRDRLWPHLNDITGLLYPRSQHHNIGQIHTIVLPNLLSFQPKSTPWPYTIPDPQSVASPSMQTGLLLASTGCVHILFFIPKLIPKIIKMFVIF